MKTFLTVCAMTAAVAFAGLTSSADAGGCYRGGYGYGGYGYGGYGGYYAPSYGYGGGYGGYYPGGYGYGNGWGGGGYGYGQGYGYGGYGQSGFGYYSPGLSFGYYR
ncbi:MAG: hypothetical protein KF861_22230 [Planctomycetaceae bacterium]|nr:hypothetical protein [Planctomycetaceae bacterium]